MWCSLHSVYFESTFDAIRIRIQAKSVLKIGPKPAFLYKSWKVLCTFEPLVFILKFRWTIARFCFWTHFFLFLIPFQQIRRVKIVSLIHLFKFNCDALIVAGQPRVCWKTCYVLSLQAKTASDNCYFRKNEKPSARCRMKIDGNLFGLRGRIMSFFIWTSCHRRSRMCAPPRMYVPCVCTHAVPREAIGIKCVKIFPHRAPQHSLFSSTLWSPGNHLNALRRAAPYLKSSPLSLANFSFSLSLSLSAPDCIQSGISV